MTRQHAHQAKSVDRTATRGRRHAIAILLALPLFAITVAGCEDTESATETTQPAGLVAPITTPSAEATETPPAELTPKTTAAIPSPEPKPAPTAASVPTPEPTPAPAAVVAPEPEPAAVAPEPAAVPELDPDFGSCKKAVAAGYGNYVSGVDPEYGWYRDADKDGIVCEF